MEGMMITKIIKHMRLMKVKYKKSLIYFKILLIFYIFNLHIFI